LLSKGAQCRIYAVAAGGGNGISSSKALGINYRSSWGRGVSSYGSYNFSQRGNATTGTTYQQDVNPDNIRYTDRRSSVSTLSGSHRLSGHVEFRIDSNNFL